MPSTAGQDIMFAAASLAVGMNLPTATIVQGWSEVCEGNQNHLILASNYLLIKETK